MRSQIYDKQNQLLTTPDDNRSEQNSRSSRGEVIGADGFTKDAPGKAP